MLDADAQEFADALTRLMPAPFHVMGVAASREFIASFPQPDSMIAVHDVTDVAIPAGGHDVRVRIIRPFAAMNLPVLVWLHGGGWVFGSIEGSEPLCRNLAMRSDCIVVTVDYRLAPENPYPAPLNDCLDAFRWVRAHIHEFGGDPLSVAIGGDSAGGNLAVGVTRSLLDEGDDVPVFQLLAYPALEWRVDRPSRVEHAEAPLLTQSDAEWFMTMYAGDASNFTDERAFPSNSTSFQGFPPTLVIGADVDVLRDEGVAFAETLRRDGVSADSIVYPGVFHGFFTEVDFISRADQAVTEAATRLRSALAAAVEHEPNTSAPPHPPR